MVKQIDWLKIAQSIIYEPHELGSWVKADWRATFSAVFVADESSSPSCKQDGVEVGLLCGLASQSCSPSCKQDGVFASIALSSNVCLKRENF
jgi:hypothetical protein